MYKKLIVVCSLLAVSLALLGCKKVTVPEGAEDTANGGAMGKHAADNEEVFIVNMIPHHQEAIDNSLIVIEKSTNEEVKALASKIVAAQNSEVAIMEGRLNERYPHDALQSSYEDMMPDLSTLEGDALDKAYLEGMIEHHEGAIQMANDVLMLAERKPEVDQLAVNIKTTQTEEIDEMKAILETIE